MRRLTATPGMLTPECIPLDSIRDNDLETAAWSVLRFATHHVREEMDEYCVPTIVDNIDRLGGLNTGGLASRTVWLDVQEGTRQLILFETGTDYSLD